MDDFATQQLLAAQIIEAKKQQIVQGKKQLLHMEAQNSMTKFMQAMFPDPDATDDTPTASLMQETPLLRLLCQIIERVDRGEIKRVCVSVGPQFGKSQVLSRGGPAWLSGRKPARNMILGTYNDTFAQEFGGEVRDLVQTEQFQAIFPGYSLKKGSEAKDNLKTHRNGKIAFVGVGGSGTGKPADIFFVDDPFKNDEDAQSETYREKVWSWFNGVAMSRCHKDSAIIIVHTRWNEDDLIGRLCDPEHPERNKKYKGISDRWEYFNLPAIVEDASLAAALGLTLEVPTDPFVRQMFGEKPMVSLWEERKDLPFLAEAKQNDPRIFGALYMGKPSPDAGTYFQKEDLLEYDREELPKNLQIYGASDHALSMKEHADYTALGCVGVDENDEIWILPDLVWDRLETDVTVEELLVKMKKHNPVMWFIEDELISKSFGPFLLKRMHEESVYTPLQRMRPSKDKRTRARSIQGRVQMQKVHFPRFASWWPAAKQQLLKFPYSANDDFVDFISWIGLGLTMEYSASKEKGNSNVIKVGTLDWIKRSSDLRSRREKRERDSGGW